MIFYILQIFQTLKTRILYLLIFSFTTTFYGQIQSYYNGLDLNKTGNDLYIELSNRLKSTHTSIPYTGTPPDVWSVLKDVDEDPTNSLNVLLIYGSDDSDGDYIHTWVDAATSWGKLKSCTPDGGNGGGNTKKYWTCDESYPGVAAANIDYYLLFDERTKNFSEKELKTNYIISGSISNNEKPFKNFQKEFDYMFISN